jgi:hypothetical protein
MAASALVLVLVLGGSTGTDTGGTADSGSGGSSETAGPGGSESSTATEDTGGSASDGSTGATGEGSGTVGSTGTGTSTTSSTGASSTAEASSAADDLGSDTFYGTDPTYGDFTPEGGCIEADDEDPGCCDQEENNSDNFCSVSRRARDRIALAVILVMLARPRRPKRRDGGAP